MLTDRQLDNPEMDAELRDLFPAPTYSPANERALRDDLVTFIETDPPRSLDLAITASHEVEHADSQPDGSSRPVRWLMVAAVAGIVVAGIALVPRWRDPELTSRNAVKSDSSTSVEPEVTVQSDLPLLMPAVTGQEPPVFSGKVSAAIQKRTLLRPDAILTLSTDTGGGVCVQVDFKVLTGTSCYNRETILAGMAAGAYQAPDRVIRVVGIAPDDAAVVEIAGQRIEVVDNVWYMTAKPGTDLSYVIQSTDGAVTASLGK